MTLILEKILDHKEQGLDRLLDQFKGKPRIAAWAGAYLKQVQLLENAIWDVIFARFLDLAVGVNLDTLGKIVGESRQGRDDTNYRRFIRARVRINRSKGNTKDVLDVLNIITATNLLFKEYKPATLYIEMLTISDEDVVLLYSQLRDTKAGGVKLTIIHPTSNTLQLLPTSNATHVEGTDGSVTVPAALNKVTFTSAVPDPEFPADVVGASIVVSGSADPVNDGTFVITDWVDGNTIKYVNAVGTADANNGALIFSIDRGVVGGANVPAAAAGDANQTKASQAGSTIGPFALTEGMVLSFAVDGVAKTVRFTNLDEDFVNLGAATAAEVVAFFNKQGVGRRSGLRASVDGGAIKLTRTFAGLEHDFQITAGGANAVLGFDTLLTVGTIATDYGWASDAVTVRDPNAEPIETAPGPPTVLYLIPPEGPEY